MKRARGLSLWLFVVFALLVPTRLPAPVPVSEGEMGTGAGGPQAAEAVGQVEVLEQQIDDDLTLQSWLNQEAANGRQLQAVVPVRPGLSLFVYVRHAAPASCSVILDSVRDGDLKADRLAERIAQQVNKTFVGVHFLAPGTSALVFRDGR